MIGGRSVLFRPWGWSAWGGIAQTRQRRLDGGQSEMRWEAGELGENLGWFHARFQPRQQHEISRLSGTGAREDVGCRTGKSREGQALR